MAEKDYWAVKNVQLELCSNLFDKDGIADVLDLDLGVVEAVGIAAVGEYVVLVDESYHDVGVVVAAADVFLYWFVVCVADTISHDYIVVFVVVVPVVVVVVDIFVDDNSVVDGDTAVFVDLLIDNHVHSGEHISVLVDAMHADMAVDKSADDDSSADHYSRNMNDVDDFRFSHDAQDLGEELSDGL